MTLIQIQPSTIPSNRAGCWLPSPTGSLATSWASSSLTFIFTGKNLTICAGPQTERKDKSNGGTHMLAVVTGPTEASLHQVSDQWKTFDPIAGSEIVIFDGDRVHEKTVVRVVLIDWASTFEVSSLIVDEDATIEGLPSPNSCEEASILLIGDSICVGFAVPIEEGGERIPHGVLNAFPFVANRIKQASNSAGKFTLELYGYPGLALITPTEDEKDKGNPGSMAEAFFYDAPRSKTPRDLSNSKPQVIIIELGSNDQFFYPSVDRFAKNLEEFISKLVESFSSTLREIWLVPPFPDRDTENRHLNAAFPALVNPIQRKIGSQIQVRICDLVEGLTVDDTIDGIHPTLKSHQAIGQKLAKFIDEYLAREKRISEDVHTTRQ